ncbi:MAG: succinate dehydrogenase assembly factor 4 [Pseudomonadota bacterium]
MSKQNSTAKSHPTKTSNDAAVSTSPAGPEDTSAAPARPKEIGGPKGPEPTRYGDWEKNGRCTDF